MNKKLLIFTAIIAILAIGFYFFSKKQPQSQASKPPTNVAPPSQTDPPKITSTKPDPLENSIVSANQTIEITFNRPLENVGEFKSKIEPKVDYKVELSGDRKTAKIIPTKPFDLGLTYTFFIGTESKFDGVGRWGQEKIFHFKTITYRGV